MKATRPAIPALTEATPVLNERAEIAHTIMRDLREDARLAADIEANINKAARSHERNFQRAMQLQIDMQNLPAFRSYP